MLQVFMLEVILKCKERQQQEAWLYRITAHKLCLGPHRTQIRGNKLWAALCEEYRESCDKLMTKRKFLEPSLEFLKFNYSASRQQTFNQKLKFYDEHGGLDGGREALLAIDNVDDDAASSEQERKSETTQSPVLPSALDPKLPTALDVSSDSSASESPQQRFILCLGFAIPLLPKDKLQEKRGKLLEKAQNCGDQQQVQQLQNAMAKNDPYVDALDCVQYAVGGLPEIAARDFVRGHVTERECNAVVFGVSKDSGATLHHHYKHVQANFNRSPSFLKQLQQALDAAQSASSASSNATKIRFSEAILDYFWIPDGTWQIHHWKSQFFSETLVGLVEKDLLSGNVYLPFTLHCFTQVLIARHHLLQWCDVKFLRKENLSQVSLWKGTQVIDASVCQQVLGKHLQQEETECSFDSETVKGWFFDGITKEEVFDYARQLEDFGSIRFIVLETLSPDKRSKPTLDRKVLRLGKILGLQSPKKVQRGIATYSMPKQPFNERQTKKRKGN